MTNLRKITEQDIEEYVSELGEMEQEHRKGSTFYATSTYIFKEDDIKTLADEGVDASQLLNVCVTLSGIYDDWNGTDWDSIDYCKVEEYQELVPEQIIPEHYVTKQRNTPFKPEFE